MMRGTRSGIVAGCSLKVLLVFDEKKGRVEDGEESSENE